MEGKRIQTAEFSIIGDRATQQDACRRLWENDTFLGTVCDGMGGMSGGERASACAVQGFTDAFNGASLMPEEEYGQWINDTFQKIDLMVSGISNEQGELIHPGTTALVALVKENRFYWGSVGDSRIYYLRGEELHTLNRMHNYNMVLDDRINSGEITQAQAIPERSKGEALVSFLGIGGLRIMDILNKPIEMKPGDVAILVSDGVYKSLDDQQVQAIIEESGYIPSVSAERLCREAYRLTKGKQDNTTVLVIKCIR